jgi:hypothetical protein
MDIIREIQITLHGFGKHPLNEKVILLKMISTKTKVNDIKSMISIKMNLKEDDLNTSQLTWKQEVLWDDYDLAHYKYRNVLAQNYAILDLYKIEELAVQASITVSQQSRRRWKLAGDKVRKKVLDAFIPDPAFANQWKEKSGHPYESASTRHAKARGGTKGVIDLLSSYPKHSTNAEECCWCLLVMASESEEANDFRERLIEREHVTPLIVAAFKRGIKKLHYGAMKQSIGLLYYLSKDQPKKYLNTLIQDYNLMILCGQTLKICIRGLSKLKQQNKNSAKASVFGDLCELGANLIYELIKHKAGKSQFKKLKLKGVMKSIDHSLEYLIYPESITTAFNRCLDIKK